MNRHAGKRSPGATGTGKTKTLLQIISEFLRRQCAGTGDGHYGDLSGSIAAIGSGK